MKSIYPVFRLFFFLITLSVVFRNSSIAQIPNGYYESVKGLKGEKLKSGLSKILCCTHQKIRYNGDSVNAWNVLKFSDRDTNDTANVILFYTGRSVRSAKDRDGKRAWNREHVWAVSHGNFKKNSLPFNDLHNLKPSNSNENSRKGNKDFDCGGIKFIQNSDNTRSFYDDDSWEPHDFVKGDVARILFYMAVRYEGCDGNPDLELVDSVGTVSLTIPGVKGYYGKLSLLLAWNKSDPVSNFERNRNEVIYKHQRNRNPFIDHPEFADMIWGEGKMKPPCRLISKNGEIVKEFEFVGNSGNDKELLKPGKYNLIIIANDKEQIYKVKISK